MKVYTLMHYCTHHPLYVCSSRELAEQMSEEMKIDCYVQEVPFMIDERNPRASNKDEALFNPQQELLPT